LIPSPSGKKGMLRRIAEVADWCVPCQPARNIV
jgi:hypothetical protein